MEKEAGFHYPGDIHLPTKPLAEAWLELQWQTADAPPAPTPGLPLGIVDTHFQLALGSFYQYVDEKYSVREPLPASQFPVEMTAHTVTYRFRDGKEGWPLMQIGPGVASVNFTHQYTWTAFRKEALFLREAVLGAYKGVPLLLTEIILRYRDVFFFDYREQDLQIFLREKLHIDLSWPSLIPGHLAERSWPTDFGMNLGFRLNTPRSAGNLRLTTALQSREQGAEVPIIIADFEMRAVDTFPSLLDDSTAYATWLDQAHDVVHEWFFALIEGELRSQYERGDA